MKKILKKALILLVCTFLVSSSFGINIVFAQDNLPKTPITEKEKEAIVDYDLKNFDKEEYILMRQEKVQNLGLESNVDENYFLTDDYIENNDLVSLLNSDIHLLLDETTSLYANWFMIKLADSVKENVNFNSFNFSKGKNTYILSLYNDEGLVKTHKVLIRDNDLVNEGITPFAKNGVSQIKDLIGYYSEVLLPDGSTFWRYDMGIIEAYGKIAFCVEPGIGGLNGTYKANKNHFDDSKEAVLERIAYHGYDNTKKSDRDYLATQYMIWENIGAKFIDWGGPYTKDEYASDKADINTKIASHKDNVSFHNGTGEVEVGKSISFTDTNNLLSKYEVNSDGGSTVTIDKNKLTISVPTDYDKDTLVVTLNKFPKDKIADTVVYESPEDDGQDVTVLSLEHNQVTAKVTLDVLREGKAKVQKSSSNTDISSGSSAYSLAGAVYGLYSDASTTNKVGEFVTNENGTSNELTLAPGTYYAKEITAPKGFYLDTTVYPVTVKPNETTTLNVQEKPKSDPLSVILGKVDRTTNQNKPQGSASLSGAEFTLKFYKGEYAENVDPSSLGKSPDRTWVLRTDANGKARLNDSHKVSGDPFYLNELGTATLPFGNLVIQETKAPKGYLINNEKFVVKVTPGQTDGVSTYNMPEVPEQVILGDLEVQKVDSSNNAPVKKAGFTFEVYDSSGNKVDTIVTNSSGIAKTKKLPYGSYTIKETKAVDGYLLSTQTINATISDNNKTYSFTYRNDEVKGQVNITKYDSDLNTNNTQGDSVLAGAVYGIYAKENILAPWDSSVVLHAKDTKINEVRLNDKGQGTFNNLYLGKYYVKELVPPQGFLLDNTKYDVTLSYANDKTPIIIQNANVSDRVIKGRLNIYKVISEGDSSQINKPEEGAEFIVMLKKYVDKYGSVEEAYKHKNEFKLTEYDYITTDKNGNALTRSLAYGDYMFKQVASADNIATLVGEHPFSITSDNQIVNKFITNVAFKSYLKLLKVDEETNQTITYSNASFELYKYKDDGTLELVTMYDREKKILVATFEERPRKFLKKY